MTAPCEICAGYGWTRREDGGFLPCRCLRRQRIRNYIDSHEELVGTHGVTASPLVVERKPYKGSCILEGGWDVVKSHIVTWLGWSYVPGEKPKLGILNSNELKELFMRGKLVETVKSFDVVVVRMLPTDNPLFGEVMGAVAANVRRVWVAAAKPYNEKHAAWTELAESWPVYTLEDVADRRTTKEYFKLGGAKT